MNPVRIKKEIDYIENEYRSLQTNEIKFIRSDIEMINRANRAFSMNKKEAMERIQKHIGMLSYFSIDLLTNTKNILKEYMNYILELEEKGIQVKYSSDQIRKTINYWEYKYEELSKKTNDILHSFKPYISNITDEKLVMANAKENTDLYYEIKKFNEELMSQFKNISSSYVVFLENKESKQGMDMQSLMQKVSIYLKEHYPEGRDVNE